MRSAGAGLAATPLFLFSEAVRAIPESIPFIRDLVVHRTSVPLLSGAWSTNAPSRLGTKIWPERVAVADR